MVCANPNCSCRLFDVPGGTIWLLQLERPDVQPTDESDETFSIPSLRHKYFWLCAACSRRFVLQRWTPTGVLLAPKQLDARYTNAQNMEPMSSPFSVSVHASAQVEEEFLDVG
jgi:hypothetical protein